MRGSVHPIIALSLLFVVWGCSKEKEEPSSGKSAPPAQTQTTGKRDGYQTVEVQNGGTISGKVTFRGSWKPAAISVTKDQKVCGKSKRESSLIISKGGEVRNAVVHLSDIQRGKALGEVKPVLDQKGCEYKPHVLAFPVGTTLEILNSDGILHNVHSFSEKNAPFNRAQPKYLKKITTTFSKAETIPIKCDVHGWMSAWLFVAENPYYEVTTEDGSFKLTDVPPGDYTLEVWHEKLGKQTKKIKVGPNETVEINFEFATPVS